MYHNVHVYMCIYIKHTHMYMLAPLIYREHDIKPPVDA